MDGVTLPRIKCLLVDDLEDNLLALAALLQSEDVETFCAQSGPEALELLLVHDFALAFLDVQMPDMDGFELAELMRGSERTRHVPIIFVTAGAREQQRVFKGYESGPWTSSTSPSSRTFSRTRPMCSSSSTASASSSLRSSRSVPRRCA